MPICNVKTSHDGVLQTAFSHARYATRMTPLRKAAPDERASPRSLTKEVYGASIDTIKRYYFAPRDLQKHPLGAVTPRVQPVAGPEVYRRSLATSFGTRYSRSRSASGLRFTRSGGVGYVGGDLPAHVLLVLPAGVGRRVDRGPVIVSYVVQIAASLLLSRSTCPGDGDVAYYAAITFGGGARHLPPACAFSAFSSPGPAAPSDRLERHLLSDATIAARGRGSLRLRSRSKLPIAFCSNFHIIAMWNLQISFARRRNTAPRR